MSNLFDPIPARASKTDIQSFAEKLAATRWPNRAVTARDMVRSQGGDIQIRHDLVSARERESIVVDWDNSFIINLPVFTSVARDSFTICHELGHYFLHWPLVKVFLEEQGVAHPRMIATRWVDESSADLMLAEKEANWFAAAFLFPRKLFEESLARNEDLKDVAKDFGASIRAVEVRKSELGL